MNKNNDIKVNLADLASPLMRWYDSHARILPWRENPLPYHVWVSEIMLQQTRVEAVKPFFDRWIQELPSIATLAYASEQQILKLWEGLGYYNRVRNMQKAAQVVMEKFQGQLPASFDDLLALPGIGEYTAGAVASIAFQLPVSCVDGNVLRVITRVLAEKQDITKAAVKQQLTEQVRKIIPKSRPGDFNQALMELGAVICLPNGSPKCEICPVSYLCEAFRQNTMLDFPIKAAKKPRKVEERTVFVLIKGNKVALRKRESRGLLAGLWEFPNVSDALSLLEVEELLGSWGLFPSTITELNAAKHIFTHIEWHMTGYLALVNGENGNEEKDSNENFQWVSVDILKDQLALPSAFKSYYKAMIENF